MLFQVVGVFNGVSKTSGKPFYVLHCVELEREQNNLRGYSVNTYFCTKDVADYITPGKTYKLESSFGSKNVIAAELVDTK